MKAATFEHRTLSVGIAYGRSPAMDALPDVRAFVERSQFALEQMHSGLHPIPRGLTIWRDPVAATWHRLPNPALPAVKL